MNKMKLTEKELKYELVVVGGGLSGLAAAIASAREGVKTALINNRPVLGGNASSEVKMHICGADSHAQKKNARETGILEEILLENKRRNQSDSFYLLDSIMWEKARFQENLDLFLNTQMTDVTVVDKKIKSVKLYQLTNETVIEMTSPLFVDATGDGTLGYLAGADWMMGREGKDVFNEPLAPDHSDDYVMGSSIQFTSVDTGSKVDFIKPEWAYTYTEEDLKYRGHSQYKDGYWWIELGGDGIHDTITDAEDIRDELLKVVFGVWDHIKNGGDHRADNFELDWIGFLPGKRESRRLVGDYVFTSEDIMNNRSFDDAIAYGGWPIDMHAVKGIHAKGEQPTSYYRFKHIYEIPYRSLYSKNISNLFMAGRNISVTDLAFGSTRVMGTCAVVGEAVGLAASIAAKKGATPREVNNYMTELQQLALKNDLYVPNIKNEDGKDLARNAKVTASSYLEGYEPENVINGIARTVGEESNCWLAQPSNNSEWLSLKLAKDTLVSELSLKFDSNLSKEIMLSLSEQRMKIQDRNAVTTLVKDYAVHFLLDGKEVEQLTKKDNYLRNVVLNLEQPIMCDEIKLVIESTNGVESAKVFEVRVY